MTCYGAENFTTFLGAARFQRALQSPNIPRKRISAETCGSDANNPNVSSFLASKPKRKSVSNSAISANSAFLGPNPKPFGEFAPLRLSPFPPRRQLR